MKNQEINKRIAKLLGWTKCVCEYPHCGAWYSAESKEPSLGVPNYAESLDACREFEASMNGTEKVVYADHLVDLCGDDSYDPIFATAMKRCEAFLRLKGQWE